MAESADTAPSATAANILVVDDDESMRLLVHRVLERAGYTVFVASNGLEALLRIDRSRPDLVISDINMPELGGLDMVQGLRNRPETHTMPIIFITGSDDRSHFAESLNLKARSFLAKPFSNDKLVEKVKQILGR